MDYKEVNSPLISYTLYDPESKSVDQEAQLPDGSNVQIVFKHEVDAKYPSVRTLHRDRDEGEEISTVMDSSICSYLRNEGSNGDWIWDGNGCRVVSTNRTHTVCRCTHLTGFADLMDFHSYNVILFTKENYFFSNSVIKHFNTEIGCPRYHQYDVQHFIHRLFGFNFLHTHHF